MDDKFETGNYIAIHKALEQMLEAMVNENEPYCEAEVTIDTAVVEIIIAFKEV